jgi:hypothetical protein
MTAMQQRIHLRWAQPLPGRQPLCDPVTVLCEPRALQTRSAQHARLVLDLSQRSRDPSATAMLERFVLIGTPCYGGLVTHLYMQSVLRLMMAPPEPQLRLGLIMSAHDSLITRARNAIVANFLDTPEATHLMFIDADIGFEPSEFYRLLAFDEDLAAGRYPLKVRDWEKTQALLKTAAPDANLESLGLSYVGHPCAVSEIEARDGFMTGIYAGTGFMLIKRRVLERMIAAYPETKYREGHTYPKAKQPSPHLYNLFDCTIDRDTGDYLSEDFTFCSRWRQLGEKLWLDTQSALVHVGSHEFRGEPLVKLA